MRKRNDIPAAGVTVTDKLAFGHLTRIFPVQTVRNALERCGCQTQRVRDLPTELIVYLQIIQGWFVDRTQKESLACVTESLQYLYGIKEFKLPSKAALSKRRSRVGSRPLQILFDEVCKPLSKPQTKGSYYRDWLLTGLDGTDLDVEDTPANDLHFGRSRNQVSVSPYPKARAVALAELGTRTAFELEIGKNSDSEIALASRIIPRLSRNYLVLADRLFMSYELFTKASETGAALLFRARLDRVLKPIEVLEDGSYLAYIYPSEGKERKAKASKVRVIEYEVKSSQSGEIVRLITNILNSNEFPSNELAALYHERWEIETMLDEVKTHLGVRIIRSRTPELARQEIFGLLMAHYALKSIMHDAALEIDVDPDDLSFIHSVRVVRRAIVSSGAFPPSSV